MQKGGDVFLQQSFDADWRVATKARQRATLPARRQTRIKCGI
jgi:hypothetical protein